MRDFHATPELCPPPAASADIARRRLLTAVAAAPVIAVTPAFAERRSDDDAPIFEMARQISGIEAEIRRLCDEAEARHGALPRIKWSPEELAQHRIVGAHDAPRRVTQSELNDSDRRDKPRGVDCKITDADDGVTLVQTYTTTRRTPAAAEITAWQERCAARRALYDEKNAARDEAKAVAGIEKIENTQAELWKEIYKILEKLQHINPKRLSALWKKCAFSKMNMRTYFHVRRMSLILATASSCPPLPILSGWRRGKGVRRTTFVQFCAIGLDEKNALSGQVFLTQ
jgi:hypothetical protein